MVDAAAPNPERREHLTQRLEIVLNFLKNQFREHAVKADDEVPTHGLQFSLGKASAGGQRNGKCKACDFVTFFLKELQHNVEQEGSGPEPRMSADAVQDALKVLADTAHKFKLYQGHCARVRNQQAAIAAIHKELAAECLATSRTTRAVITVDWKMKFEATSARETTRQHYGKRGLSWHGCLVTYYRPKQVTWETSDGTSVEVTEAERVNVYIDQIMDGDNKQEVAAVGSMLEAALEHVHRELPPIESVILQSDNAKCYNSNTLRVLISLINTRSALKVERHIFTETQDGKGLIDAHFARATAHVKRFMRHSQRNRIRAISTPRGLGCALAWQGGITNSCVQLVRVNRSKTDDIAPFLDKAGNALKKWFSRCNDLFFVSNFTYNGCLYTVDHLTLAAEAEAATLRFRVFAYSGIGDGSEFAFHLGTAKAVHVVDPDDDLQNEDNVQPSGCGEDATTSAQATSSSSSSSSVANFILDDAAGNAGAIDASDGENSDNEVDNDDDTEHDETIAQDSSYVAVNENGDNLLTGVAVLKQSGFDHIVGPRSASRRTRDCGHHKPDGRKNLLAFGVRLAAHLVKSEDVPIRDGREDMPEYEESASMVTEPREQGWGRRKRHGEQYGAVYLHDYAELQSLQRKGDPRKCTKQSRSFTRIASASRARPRSALTYRRFSPSPRRCQRTSTQPPDLRRHQPQQH